MCDIICAGHICLDITPVLSSKFTRADKVFQPGKLLETEELVLSTGGSVANTGIALTKLGIKTALMGKIGDDIPGNIVKTLLKEQGGQVQYLSIGRNEFTSYSVVLAPHGFDRMFLHNPAANHTFGADDIDYDLVQQAKILHIGYPTCMKKLAQNSGVELRNILRKGKELGVTTSIDTSYPDEDANGFNIDWEELFCNVLPFTDIFMPSIEEALFMFDHDEFCRLKAMNGDILENLNIDHLPHLGKKLLEMGAKIVIIKCGTRGYYAVTQGIEVLSGMGRGMPVEPEQWADKEIFSGIYHVDHVKSATGAGDTSIGGFLAALIRGYSLTDSVNIACATGAACVTSYSATGGIEPLEKIVLKSQDEWKKMPLEYTGQYFHMNIEQCLLERQ